MDKSTLTPEAATGGNSAAADGRAHRLEVALRDLVWRVEHVRSLLAGEGLPAASALLTLLGLLDTSGARAALGLEPCESSLRLAGGRNERD